MAPRRERCEDVGIDARNDTGDHAAVQPGDGGFRAVAESVQDALVAADGHSEIIFWSPSASRIFGWSADEALGRPLTMLMPERLRDAHSAGIARLREGGEPRVVGGPPVELTGLRADGSEFPIELSLGRWTQDGSPRFTGVIRDISQRKRAERIAATQYEVAQALAGAPSVESASIAVLRALGEGMGWQLGHLWEADEAEGVLRSRATWQAAGTDAGAFVADSEERRFARGEGLPGRVWSSGAPAWVRNVGEDDNFPRGATAARAGLHGAVALPLVADGEVRGVAEFFATEIREADEELAAAMEALGHQLGEFLLRREAESRLADATGQLERRHALQRQASELNDEVVQGLVLAHYNLRRGDLERAAETIDATLEAARSIISDLLGEADIAPGDLRRESPARLPGAPQDA